MIRRGQVCVPGATGPVRARARNGGPLDPFDAVDVLRPTYDRLYLVDLDGIERGTPQVEYMQELSREIDLWVDAGVATADSAIDILVAGAQRAVLSSAYLRAPVEVRRAWKLSTDWAFEVEVVGGRAQNSGPAWDDADPVSLAERARRVGFTEVIVSPRGEDPDWNLVRAVASGGSTWVDGSFSSDQLDRLRSAGAAGGIFHIDGLLKDLLYSSTPPTPAATPVSPRDDEN
jgi:hypothetical protein